MALQFVVLGLVMRCTALAVESMLAVFAGSIGLRLARSPRLRLWQQRLSGALVIAIGVRLLWLENPREAIR